MEKRRAQVTILLLRRSPAIMDMVWITPLYHIKVNNYTKLTFNKTSSSMFNDFFYKILNHFISTFH